MVEDMRRELAEGRRSVPAVGAVAKGGTSDLPFVVVGATVGGWSRSLRTCGISCSAMRVR